jgi:biotin carboxyl carrier protein
VFKCHVAVGDVVERGQPLMILEAMKMEHVLEAPRGGVVKALHAGEGATVDDGLLLVEIIDEDDNSTLEK